jgi:hypothetical protein
MDPDIPNNSTTDGDPEMTDSSFINATLVLILPFLLIPVSIITSRLVKYLWKVYQAKKYGYGILLASYRWRYIGRPFGRIGVEDTPWL